MTSHDSQHTPDLDAPERPGQELRSARERAGIGREFMADRLRLALAQFDALEHDDYAELPPPAFVRGYIRAYARELGLEPEQYVAAFDRTGVSANEPELRTGNGVNAPAGRRGPVVGLLLIALVAAGGIGAWWYQQRMLDVATGSADTDTAADDATAASGVDGAAGDGDAEPASADADATAATGESDADGDPVTADTDGGSADDDGDAPDGTDTAATEEAAAGDGTTADTSAQADDAERTASAEDAGGDTGGVPGAGESSPSTTPEPQVDASESAAGTADDGTAEAPADDDTDADNGADTEVAADATADGAEPEPAPDSEPGETSPAATDSPASAATDAASTGPDEVTLEFDGRSWLEVYDDRGRELMYTLYFGSEPVTLRGWAPFEIFLGNSPAVEVRFNGEIVDKSAFTRSNNTARFIVDPSGARAR